jgi:hypothetical protein
VRKDELITAAALAVGGVLAITVVIPRYVAGTAVGGGLSPAFMPYVAAALVTLSALGILVGGLRHSDESASQARLTTAHLRFLGCCALVLGASYALMSVAGYVAGGIVLMAGLLGLARARLVTIVVAAVVAPTLLWLLFVELLATPLP